MKSYDIQRMVFGVPTILISFTLVGLDAGGVIDITKFGYAALGTWITLILQFYFRKSGVDTLPTPPTEPTK
jgi:hypothetical protein